MNDTFGPIHEMTDPPEEPCAHANCGQSLSQHSHWALGHLYKQPELTDSSPNLLVEFGGGRLLEGTLQNLAIRARTSANGALLPFTYRDPIDPENPDALRPVRRACLRIEQLGTLPEEPNIPIYRKNSDGSWGIEMITPSEWEDRRPTVMDE